MVGKDKAQRKDPGRPKRSDDDAGRGNDAGLLASV